MASSRRSRERITLELAGLCLGLVDQPPVVDGPACRNRTPWPSWSASQRDRPRSANPLTAALASLDLSLDLIRTTAALAPSFRAELLQELAGVGEGMEQPSSSYARFRTEPGEGWPRSERFDAAQVVRSCVALERPLAGKRSVALQEVIRVSGVFLQGDPNALYQVLTNSSAMRSRRRWNGPRRRDQPGAGQRDAAPDGPGPRVGIAGSISSGSSSRASRPRSSARARDRIDGGASDHQDMFGERSGGFRGGSRHHLRSHASHSRAAYPAERRQA